MTSAIEALGVDVMVLRQVRYGMTSYGMALYGDGEGDGDADADADTDGNGVGDGCVMVMYAAVRIIAVDVVLV